MTYDYLVIQKRLLLLILALYNFSVVCVYRYPITSMSRFFLKDSMKFFPEVVILHFFDINSIWQQSCLLSEATSIQGQNMHSDSIENVFCHSDFMTERTRVLNNFPEMFILQA